MLEGLAKTDPLRDPDEIVLDDVRLYVRRGQIWRLGSHRLICADATETRTLACLLAGRRADMAITDPPYNVDYGRHGGSSSRRQRVIANDCLPAEEWESFTREWAARLIGSVEGAIYVFMSCKEWPTVSRILGEVGGHWSDTIIWAKDQFVLGRADYQRQHEPIWYGWRERSRRQWLGGRGQGDVWSIPRPRASDLHPTMKPVALLEKAIANSSAPGARVLDPFVGSGSTLIACERLGRRCLAAEIEPRWVQTTIARWEAYAGRRAELEERNDKWCNL